MVNRERKKINVKPNWMKNKMLTKHAGGRGVFGRDNTFPLCVCVCGCASVWRQQKAQNFYARSFDLISAAIFFLVPSSTLATLGESERREGLGEGRAEKGAQRLTLCVPVSVCECASFMLLLFYFNIHTNTHTLPPSATQSRSLSLSLPLWCALSLSLCLFFSVESYLYETTFQLVLRKSQMLWLS